MADDLKFPTLLQCIGKTPLLRLPRLSAKAGAEILAKAEFLNPLGSVKDRIGLAMIEAAEQSGELKAGMRVLEPTSGNTGIALAFVCAAKGYPLTLIMPETMSLERRTLLILLGAELILTPGPLGMKGAITKAHELAKEIDGVFIPSQFENPANPNIHAQTTAEEIWQDTHQGQFDVFVAGVGTGGTISGCGRVFKARRPEIKVFAIEPSESPVIQGGEAGAHKIQGLGAGFVPKNLDLKVLDGSLSVSSEDSLEMTRQVIREEGLPIGISSGAALLATCRLAAKAEFKGKRFVTVLPSYTERYLSSVLGEDAQKIARQLKVEKV